LEQELKENGLYVCAFYIEKDRLYSHTPLYPVDNDKWHSGCISFYDDKKKGEAFYICSEKKKIPIIRLLQEEDKKWNTNICGHISESENWSKDIKNKRFILLDNTLNNKPLRALLLKRDEKHSAKELAQENKKLNQLSR